MSYQICLIIRYWFGSELIYLFSIINKNIYACTQHEKNYYIPSQFSLTILRDLFSY